MSGSFHGNEKLVGIQLIAVISVAAYAAAITAAILLVLKFTIGLRVSVEMEREVRSRVYGTSHVHLWVPP